MDDDPTILRANNIKLNPTSRMTVCRTSIRSQQSRVNDLLHSGRLHHQSPALNHLLQTRVRQSVLARLSDPNDAFGQSCAHYEVARCYRWLELWSHALTHAKKSLDLARAAARAGAPTSPFHRCRVMVLLGEAIAQATERTGSRSASAASAQKILERAAKLVKLSVGGDTVLDGDRDGADPYGDDFEKDDEENEENNGMNDGMNGGEEEIDDPTYGVASVSNPRTNHLARAEVCEAMAVVCGIAAVEADTSLRTRARTSAEEWLIGKEGQRRLQERTNELTNRYLDEKMQGGGGGGSGWRKSTNAATLRHEAEGRSRSQLLKEATAGMF